MPYNFKNNVTYERLKEVLCYSSETGYFTWKRQLGTRKDLVGKTAGYLQNNYIVIMIDGIAYKAHRLAWLYMTGEWPENEIDHINGTKNDNRFVNLREATKSQNQQNGKAYKNNKLGIKGVSWNKRQNKYVAQIQINGVKKHIGYYDNYNDAITARQEAEFKYFGEFASRSKNYVPS